MHADAHVADAAQWANDVNAVVQVHQAQQREGECFVGEQLHLQGEGHHVRVGWRQQAGFAEAADLAVSRQPCVIDVYAAVQAKVGQCLASDLTVYSCFAVQPGEVGFVVQLLPLDRHAQAPIMAWPHTRSTCPLTAPAPGWLSQATASATS
ncbi:hypothetical protein D3C76_948690 [compost metagenome]